MAPTPLHAARALSQPVLRVTAGKDDGRREGGIRAHLRFVLLTSGVFIFYLLYGWLLEALTREWKRDGIVLGWFLTLGQFIVYSALGGSYMAIASPKARNVPISQFAVIAGGCCSAWRCPSTTDLTHCPAAASRQRCRSPRWAYRTRLASF